MRSYFMKTARELGEQAGCDIIMHQKINDTTLVKWNMLYSVHEALIQMRVAESDWEEISEAFMNAYHNVINKYTGGAPNEN